MADANLSVEELRNLATQGRTFAGYAAFSEEKFWVQTTLIKKRMISGTADVRPPQHNPSPDVLRLIDNCEAVVQQGFHIFGTAIVNRQKFESCVNVLRSHPQLRTLSAIIEAIAATNSPKGNKAIVNEEQFYICMVKLKKGLALAMEQALPAQPADKVLSATERSLVQALVELENFVIDNAQHIFGKVVVNKATYLEKVEAVANALRPSSSMRTWN